MKKNVTMRDIGAALGVSTVTISKAFSGKDGVSSELREKILETGRRMGYRYGAPLADMSNKVIGVLMADRYFHPNTFYFSMSRALLKEISEAGMIGVPENISPEAESSGGMPLALQQASGFVLLGQFSENYVAALLETGLPVVLLDFTCDGLDVDAIVSDGQSGCFQLTRYLIEHGHERIGFVGNIDRTTSIMDRYSGYLRAIKTAGLTVQDAWTVSDGPAHGQYDERFTLPDELPTAFVCSSDLAACAMARLLRARGARVPQDVSLTGFDDFVTGPDAIPLTTYAVDQQRMAQEAVRRLLTRMREGMEGPVRVSVSGWFVARGSVMDLRTGKLCEPEEAMV